MAILAKYDGTCVECGDPIEKGVDEIEQTDDGWAHRDCAPDKDQDLVDSNAKALRASNR